MYATKLIGLFLCCALAVSALPTNNEEPRSNAIQTENDLLDSIYHDCMRKDTMSCLKYKIYNYVDKALGQKDTITVTDGVQIVKTGVDKEGAPRAITSEDTIESLLFSRVASFLESHTIKIDLKGSDIVNAVSSTARSFSDVAKSFEDEEDNSLATEESRGKKKGGKKGMMGAMMAGLGLMSAIFGKLALMKIALIAGKALIIGKIALIISAIIGLKKLLGQSGGKHVTYEVVAHPQHSSSHVSTHETAYAGGSAHGGGYGGDLGGYSGSSGHGGWGRSLEAQQMAYRGQPQAQS